MLILALALAIGLELGQSLDYDRPGLGLGQTRGAMPGLGPGPRPGMRIRGMEPANNFWGLRIMVKLLKRPAAGDFLENSLLISSNIQAFLVFPPVGGL